MLDWEMYLADYKGLTPETSERQRAEVERQILNAAVRSILSLARSDKRKWLATQTGQTEDAVENRSTLLGYGPLAESLWARVAVDMTVATAVNIMKKAKQRAVSNECTLDLAVQREIAEYDALPLVVRLSSGKLLRKRSPASLPRKTHEKTESAPDEVTGFWAGLRAMISDHFRVKLHGLDSMSVDKAWRALEVDIKVVLEDHMHKLDRLRRSHSERVQMASRGKIVIAYKTLLLQPPKPDEAIDLKPVKRQFKKLASIYHPDKSSTEETRPLYEAVVEAYRIIEESFEAQATPK